MGTQMGNVHSSQETTPHPELKNVEPAQSPCQSIRACAHQVKHRTNAECEIEQDLVRIEVRSIVTVVERKRGLWHTPFRPNVYV
jgi:hypothetical protein